MQTVGKKKSAFYSTVMFQTEEEVRQLLPQNLSIIFFACKKNIYTEHAFSYVKLFSTK